MVAKVQVAVLDEEAVGYVSCDVDQTGRAGTIGLLGVVAHARGRGLGRQLILAALEWQGERGVEDVSVITQARNIVGQRSYQRCGFTTESIGIRYHKGS